MVSRRTMLLALPALSCGRLLRGMSGATGPTATRRVAVVFPSALDPCVEAVEGLRQRFSGNDVPIDMLDLSKPGFDPEAFRQASRRAALIVAVGSDAVRTALTADPPVRTVSTMTLESDREGALQTGRVSAAVYLDIPLRTIVGELRKVFPEKTRVGVIRNPNRSWSATPLTRNAGQQPTLVQFADCTKAEDLLPVFLSFRKKVDFVVCLPDGSLYNGATARPLIMASLENRLPIVGFSPAFLRAGAAAAIYPDYRGIGEQTADLVRRCMEPGECGSSEGPRKVSVAINSKVLRMLGLDSKTSANPELVILK